jgi:hypothetical protein
MPINATVTGTAGPAQTVTAAVFTGLLSFTIDTTGVQKVFYGIKADGTNLPPISIAAATTLTLTVSGNTFTLAIS